MSELSLDRRRFLTGMSAAAAAVATSSTPILGANDKLSIGIVGNGGRAQYLLDELVAADAAGVQIVGLCDVWKPARERFAGLVSQKLPGQQPALFSRHQDLLAMPGLDAVVVATPDFAHTHVLIDAVKAGKDVFVEKPLTARLKDAVAALDVVQASKQIVQVGTQRRSSPRFQEAKRYLDSGALGAITKIETAWNRNVPSWARPIDMVRPEDVDWEQYQMYLPKRAFDASRYRRWHWYHDYTTGLVGLLGSHMIDVALWFMDDPFPASAVAIGGTLAWKDGREISDTAEYVFEFPKGWLLTFSSRLGSGPESDFEVFYGKERSLDTRDWVSRPAANRRPADAQDITLPAPAAAGRSHVGNWLDCVRSRQTPNAPIEAGFAHAVACCMGREAERTGQRVRYDAKARRIVTTT